MHRHEDPARRSFRHLFCWVFCDCRPEKRVRIRLKGKGIEEVIFEGVNFMATVKDSGGPLNVDVSSFTDPAGNQVKDTDIPVYTSSMPDVATIAANDPAGDDPQGAVITLTKKLTDPAAPCVITADFNGGDGNKVNGGFSSVGTLQVVPEAASGAVMTFSGPGLIPDA